MGKNNSLNEKPLTSPIKMHLSQKPFFPKLKRKLNLKENNYIQDNSVSPNGSRKSSSQESSNEESELYLKYRTELCKFYEINGHCKFGDNCIFAHGKENLREKTLTKSGYKKKQCINFFQHGCCMYGNRCQFSHEISKNYNNRYYHFSYNKFLNALEKGVISSDKLNEIKERPRLDVFQNFEQKQIKDMKISRIRTRKIFDMKRDIDNKENIGENYADEIAKIQNQLININPFFE